ncbi:hypothetical protein F66182_9091 [Fusarium sp. NRRL 66182]|nr:hypothetical protein F66182_9091 [Fusarium sp. NRRL 66182]
MVKRNENENEHELESLAPAPNTIQAGDAVEDPTRDAVFGEITEDGPNYRNVGWLGTSALMMKTQIGLGILSIPSAFHVLGMIPGLICLIAIAATTTWSNYEIGVFKLNHREVYGIGDAGELMFKRAGREFFGIAFALYCICTAASGMLGISISLNALSMHGTCTAAFVAVAAIVVFLCASIRTLDRISWLAWVGLVSLLAGVYVVTIAVGIQDRPSAAPKTGAAWKSDYKLVNNPEFADAMTAISSFVFAYSATPLFFPIAAEMRDPHHYTKAMLLCQSVATGTYILVGVVVYYFCGSYVASPALGSAGGTIKKVAYGLALPGLIMSATIFTHVTGKYAFVRILRGTGDLTTGTLVHWSTWLGAIFTTCLIAYIIASGIPVFGSLVSLVGALFGTMMCFQAYGCMWLKDNWNNQQRPSMRWTLMVIWSCFVIVSGMFLMVAGTYGSIVGVIESYNATGGTGAWSCADNSNSPSRFSKPSAQTSPGTSNLLLPLSLASAETTPSSAISVHGHLWGELSDPFDRIIAVDCLRMPWQHANLHRSIAFFLERTPEARCWIAAGLRTGWPKMSGISNIEALKEVGLERGCTGVERVWDTERGDDDVTERKFTSSNWISVS